MMIKNLIIFNVFFYLLLAFVWQVLFEYKFTLKYSYKSKDKEVTKQLTGFKLTFLCLFWIVFLPLAIKNTFEKEEE